ncbi:MAG: hypothetical protein IKJ19_01515 [Clostridia bacterium]|nr:hypothetical protein [Clostridia bacterium]
MIVCKFGGSIICNKRGVDFIKKRINENKERKFLVVSAIGKCSKNDKKLTDLLFDAYYERFSNDFDKYFNKVKNKFIKFCNCLAINYNEIISFNKFYAEFKVKSIEYIVSRGEYYTAKIIAKYLDFCFLPCENFLISDKFNQINLEKSKKYLSFYKFNKPCIIPGYYFVNQNNEVKLFNRGGGDVSGAIIANILKCKIYENYTNVNGILNLSPKIYKNANTIEKMNYFQAYICSKLGATVFATDAIKYIAKSRTKTIIINAKNASKNYTYIGKKGNFYYLFPYNNFSLYNKCNNCKKGRLLQAFFDDFMLHKISLKEVIYYNKKVYYRTNENAEKYNSICLKIFAKISTKLILKIKLICKKFNIIYLPKRSNKRFNYTTIYFLGMINESFIIELKDILKGLT